MRRKSSIRWVALLATFCLVAGSCSPCYKATRLRRKAGRTSGRERHMLEGKAASLEAACLKKRDAKYESKMQKEFEEMEDKARN
ncbi:MAG: hypothetical protein GF418_12615 [Chitinivibrionales bacterium]|nr:hypothetical protein [Chitinivibrionales bacterium]MBD3396462.1 hypothetical protein [Chitinivibrionales bacterium]